MTIEEHLAKMEAAMRDASKLGEEGKDGQVATLLRIAEVQAQVVQAKCLAGIMRSCEAGGRPLRGGW